MTTISYSTKQEQTISKVTQVLVKIQTRLCIINYCCYVKYEKTIEAMSRRYKMCKIF